MTLILINDTNLLEIFDIDEKILCEIKSKCLFAMIKYTRTTKETAVKHRETL